MVLFSWEKSVFFTISPQIFCKYMLLFLIFVSLVSEASNAKMMTILNQAMKQWTSQTCIRFHERQREYGYAYFHIGKGWVMKKIVLQWNLSILDRFLLSFIPPNHRTVKRPLVDSINTTLVHSKDKHFKEFYNVTFLADVPQRSGTKAVCSTYPLVMDAGT